MLGILLRLSVPIHIPKYLLLPNQGDTDIAALLSALHEDVEAAYKRPCQMPARGTGVGGTERRGTIPNGDDWGLNP